ncbi:MAG: hypothetical protein AAGE52_02690 [Myxococcota bacterium]
MKTPFFVLLASVGLACGSTPQTSAEPRSVDPSTESPTMPNTRTLTLRPDHVYEVTGIWIRDGQAQAMSDYFGRVFPIAAADYGVRPLFGLEPIHVYRGDFHPNMMFVNEWPSLDAFQGFVSDARAVALFPERDAAAERLVVTHYEVPQETTIELSEGDVIEFGAMWIKPGHEQDFRAYYETVVPLARRHGMQPLTPLRPVFSYRGEFEPTGAGLNWWGTLDAFQAFAREAEPHFPTRDAALSRLEVTHARVRLNEGET